MQKVKLITAILSILLFTNAAIAQNPPVPMGPAKLPAAKTEVKEIYNVQKQQTTPTSNESKNIETKIAQPQQTKKEVKVNSTKTEEKKQETKAPKSTKPQKTKQSKNVSEKKQISKKETAKKVPDEKQVQKKESVKQASGEKQNIKEQKATNKTNILKKDKEQEKKEPPKNQENAVKNQNEQQQQKTTVSNIKPSQINDIREQAKFLYNSNKLLEAEELFNKIPDTEKISDDWLFLANIAQDKERPIDAVFLLKKAIAADDNNYKAHYNLGNLYFYDNKLNMAMNEYRKVLKLKKDFAYAYYNKGCCYLKKESWFNARYEFGLAIKANPNEPAFYYNLAYTYKKMKKEKKAKEALEMYNKLMTQ